eukprot:TRINITY_DN10994_c0_g1_i1.p1 TRINITY_DN10994_c0_g1~~TRINITY_DN10994_c0_g1_i1.p1  ORF type:complete len:673 (+),score=134.49 TRINITY_DN10994_c0_g1_i1:101-2020(+)
MGLLFPEVWSTLKTELNFYQHYFEQEVERPDFDGIVVSLLLMGYIKYPNQPKIARFLNSDALDLADGFDLDAPFSLDKPLTQLPLESLVDNWQFYMKELQKKKDHFTGVTPTDKALEAIYNHFQKSDFSKGLVVILSDGQPSTEGHPFKETTKQGKLLKDLPKVAVATLSVSRSSPQTWDQRTKHFMELMEHLASPLPEYAADRATQVARKIVTTFSDRDKLFFHIEAQKHLRLALTKLGSLIGIRSRIKLLVNILVKPTKDKEAICFLGHPFPISSEMLTDDDKEGLSILANGIPNFSELSYPPSGEKKVWEVVSEVLKNPHVYVEEEQTNSQIEEIRTKLASPPPGCQESLSDLYSRKKSEYETAQSKTRSAKLQGAEDQLIRAREQEAAALKQWEEEGYKDTYESLVSQIATLNASKPARTWNEFKSNFDILRRAGLQVFEYYPTYPLIPQDFNTREWIKCQTMYDVELPTNSRDIGAEISFELLRVPLVRSWFPPAMAEHKFWLKGALPGYASELLLARNVKTSQQNLSGVDVFTGHRCSMDMKGIHVIAVLCQNLNYAQPSNPASPGRSQSIPSETCAEAISKADDGLEQQNVDQSEIDEALAQKILTEQLEELQNEGWCVDFGQTSSQLSITL